MWLWALAGCLTVGVVGAGGVGYGIYSFVQGVKNGSTTCLPSDFPKYPGATYADEIYELNGPYPGSTCHIVLDSNDDVATVTAFYQSKLNTGAWQVTSRDNEAEKLTFQPAKSAAPFGTVQVSVRNGGTEITIDVFTSTCLPLGFPKYPGAKFGGQSEVQGGASSGCHVVFLTNAAVEAVTAFYKSELNRGNWQVLSSGPGQVGFRLKNGTRTIRSGTVTIAVSSDRTEINVDVYP